MLNDNISYRDYGTSVIAANCNPFTIALFTGGAADIFRLYMAGNSFNSIRKQLLAQYPNNVDDITDDIENVSAFFDTSSNDNSEENRYNGTLSTIKRFAREQRLLTNATIELTTKCNLRCEHCFHSDFSLKGLEFDVIEKLLNDLKVCGVLFLCLTGGELFLRRDALTIIEAAHELGFVIELKTNGSILNDNIISTLRTKRISDIQVSVYDLEDGYSDFTRSNYSFSTVAQNIKALKDAGIIYSVSYQLTPSNLPTLDRAYDILSTLSDNFYFSYYVTPNLGDPAHNASSRISYEELRKNVLPRLNAWGMNIEPVRYRSKECGYVCWAGYEQLFISAEGIVYPCADLKVAIGNINTQRFHDIANRRFLALAEFMPREIPTCVQCKFHDYCDSCIGIAQLENGSFFKPSKHKCDLSRLQFENT